MGDVAHTHETRPAAGCEIPGVYLIWHFAPLMERVDRTSMEAVRAAHPRSAQGISTTKALSGPTRSSIFHRRRTKPVTT